MCVPPDETVKEAEVHRRKHLNNAACVNVWMGFKKNHQQVFWDVFDSNEVDRIQSLAAYISK